MDNHVINIFTKLYAQACSVYLSWPPTWLLSFSPLIEAWYFLPIILMIYGTTYPSPLMLYNLNLAENFA